MSVYWVIMPYGFVSRYYRFGGAYYLHLQGLLMSPYSVTAQKINIDITAVRNSNLIRDSQRGVQLVTS